MELTHLAAFNLTLLAAFLSPGPALLFAIATTLRNGRAAGMAAGAGLGAMAATWTLAALLGLDALFVLVPWAYGALKTAGAIYLLYVATRIWRHARDEVTARALPRHRAFASGILINLANPKSVLFSAAVLLVIFPADMSGAEKALIVADQFLFECVGYTVIAIALSRPAIRARYLAAKTALDRVSALVLGGLGARLILSR